MRRCLLLLAAAAALAVSAAAQSCPAGQTTSISGTIYAPNGTDPLPNVLVFIPSTTPAAFTPGISCPVPGALPSGAPIVSGTITATDGSFTLTNVPVAANIPLVVEAGKWRRQTVVPGTVACQNTAVDPATTRMPRNQSEGDIPLIAIATGSSDQVECVLRKVGIDDGEFTDPGGGGRINLFKASGSPGAQIDSSTPNASTLMGNQAMLNSYDVVMLPCEGNAYTKPAIQLSGLIAYANAGGRVYASHYSYDWMYRNGDFAGVADWTGSSATLADGTATIDTSFAGGATLADWLQLPTVGATTIKGQIPISTLRRDQSGVVAPTQSWMTLNSTGSVMQFTFDTPIGQTANQCGRVLFDEYHVENPPVSPAGKTFPNECSTAAITPQEKLLEFTLFDLTGSGGAPTLTPSSAAFGNEPLHFTSAAQTFTWTNNAIFPAAVTSASASGDFSVASNTCGASVAAGATCAINVVYTPAVLGAETGTLTVVSSANTLTASLTGSGVPDLAGTPSATTLNFGNEDVGATSAAQTVTWTNTTAGTITLPPSTISGDFAIAGTTCGPTLGAGSSCSFSILFKPTATGGRSGIFTTSSTDPAFSGLQTPLSGNGVDFTIAIAPGSGSVIAGLPIGPTLTLTPSTGFHAAVTLSCPATASGTTCSTGTTTLILSSAINQTLSISTISQYNVVGYGGMGGGRLGLLWLLAMGSGLLLWHRRRSAGMLLRAGLFALLLAAGGLTLSGCSGHLPDPNNPYTAPGTYTYTVSATDGFLIHTAAYTLTVTVK